jgi:hypothetical protein
MIIVLIILNTFGIKGCDTMEHSMLYNHSCRKKMIFLAIGWIFSLVGNASPKIEKAIDLPS